MKLKNHKSMATVSLQGNLIDKLEAIAYAGFEGVEMGENDLDRSPEHVSKIAKDLGLKILLFQPFRDFEGAPRVHFRKNIERAKQQFDVMNRLGVDKMLVCSNVMPDTILNDQIIVDDLGRLAECAKEYSIKIGYEALSWGIHVKSYRHAWNVVKLANHPSLGVVLDSFHTLAMNDDLYDLSTLPPEKIFFVQIADAPRLEMDYLKWSRHFRCYPGEGDLDTSGFIRKILKTGYSGPLSLEIFSDKLKLVSPRVAAFGGMVSMKNLEKKIGA